MTATTTTAFRKKETTRTLTIRTYNDLAQSDDIDDIITHILIKLGMHSHITGYYYVKRAIILAVEDPKNRLYMTKDLYYQIAKEFDVTWVSVERSIRSAIGTISCSNETKEQYIGYISDRYSSVKFLSAVAELVRHNI